MPQRRTALETDNSSSVYLYREKAYIALNSLSNWTTDMIDIKNSVSWMTL